jgi:hypothetical protein
MCSISVHLPAGGQGASVGVSVRSCSNDCRTQYTPRAGISFITLETQDYFATSSVDRNRRPAVVPPRLGVKPRGRGPDPLRPCLPGWPVRPLRSKAGVTASPPPVSATR